MFHVKLYVKIFSQVGPGQPRHVLFKGLQGIRLQGIRLQKYIPHLNTHFHNFQANSFSVMYSLLWF